MASPVHLRGNFVQTIVSMNGNTVKFRMNKVNVDEEIEDGYDNVCGEQRGTPWRMTNGFKITFEAFNQNAKPLAAYLASIKNDDAALIPFVNALGLVFRFPDGSRQAYKAWGDCTLGPLSAGIGSRTSALMLPSYMRCQYFDVAGATI